MSKDTENKFAGGRMDSAGGRKKADKGDVTVDRDALFDSFYRVVLERIEELGLTEGALSLKMGRHENYIASILYKKRFPHPVDQMKICIILNISPNYLFQYAFPKGVKEYYSRESVHRFAEFAEYYTEFRAQRLVNNMISDAGKHYPDETRRFLADHPQISDSMTMED